MEEAELAQDVGLSFQQPPLELVVHNAVMGVQHIEVAPNQVVTIAQFHTPAFTVTIKLSPDAAERLSQDIRPSPIQIARVVPQ